MSWSRWARTSPPPPFPSSPHLLSRRPPLPLLAGRDRRGRLAPTRPASTAREARRRSCAGEGGRARLARAERRSPCHPLTLASSPRLPPDCLAALPPRPPAPSRRASADPAPPSPLRRHPDGRTRRRRKDDHPVSLVSASRHARAPSHPSVGTRARLPSDGVFPPLVKTPAVLTLASRFSPPATSASARGRTRPRRRGCPG